MFNEDSNSILVTILTGGLKSSVAGKHTIDLTKGNKSDIIYEQHKAWTDQHLISLYNIDTLLSICVMRIEKNRQRESGY